MKLKTLSLLSIVSIPTALYAATGNLNPSDMVTEMQNILSQYKTQIELLQAENVMLRDLMAKHEIEIPLDAYVSAMGTGALGSSTTTVSTNSGATATMTIFQKNYIDQIHKDWDGIKGAYGIPKDSVLARHEFVIDDSGNHVYADIVSGSGTSVGAYNYKLLYEVNPENYSRTLIGFFAFDEGVGAYVTKKGSNPFSKLERNFVNDPTYTGAPALTPASSVQNPTNSVTPANLLADLKNAYEKQEYSKVLSLSDSYLANNAATYDVLRYRYRVYFITHEYALALAEIDKMIKTGMIDALTYCDASVIATYSGNTSLASTYKIKAGSSCKTN